jgi:hypothetical protein
MPNPTLFCLIRGDVVLTASVLQRIRNGSLTLSLLSENAEVRLDKPTADAVVAGTATVKVLHTVHGHRSLNQQVLSALT